MSLIKWTVSILLVIFIPIFLISATLTWAINHPFLYDRGFEKFDIAERTGITEADLQIIGKELRTYFNSPDEPLEIYTHIKGNEIILFNSKEIAHMFDVKRLIWGVYVSLLITTISIVGAIIIGFLRQGRVFGDSLCKWLFAGGTLTVVMIASIGLLCITAFDAIFLLFHRISFTNDLWRLNPSTDYLIKLFPRDFWFESTIFVAGISIAIAIFISVISRITLLIQSSAKDHVSDVN
tara:strand:- start:193 stop:903 length:711 start_codon:yes stop_codon:yes gene_type:complete